MTARLAEGGFTTERRAGYVIRCVRAMERVGLRLVSAGIGIFLERLACATLVALAVGLGLGDIAQVTALDAVVLNGVRLLLPLTIVLTLLACSVRSEATVRPPAVEIGAVAAVERRWPIFPRHIQLPFAAWLMVLLVSAALAPTNRSDALAAVERSAAGALLAWSTYLLCTTRQRWLLIARALALGGAAIAAVGLAEALGIFGIQEWLASLHDRAVPIGDVPRIASTLSHPNVAAILLELSLPLLIAWLWTAGRPWRGLVGLGALSTPVAIVLTFSRAGIVAGLAGLAVMGGVSAMRGERRRLVTLALAAMAVPAALICAAMADPGLDRRLTAELGLNGPQPSLNSAQPGRYEYWLVAWQMARDHPWLGVGPDNYRWRFAAYSGLPDDNLGVHAHDQYLEALADTGVLGLLALGWLLACLVKTGLANLRSSIAAGGKDDDWVWRTAILASLAAWLLHAVLDDFERFWPASVAFWLIAGLSLRPPFNRCGRECSTIEEPEDGADHDDEDQQNKDSARASERRAAAATTAKADHEQIVSQQVRAIQARGSAARRASTVQFLP